MATSLRDDRATGSAEGRGRLALVLNEKAGALIAGAGGADVAELAAAAGFESVPIPPGALPERLARARESGAGIVAVAGGDGTVACAAAALMESGIALGVIPCGTMNLLAKDLGLPIEDRAAALAVLSDGQARRIDVGMMGEHAFLCAAMLGTPARLGRHREQGRQDGNGWRSWLRFGRAALRVLWRPEKLRLVAVIDGRRVKLRTASLTIVVNRLDDATGRAFGRGRLDGGEFAIYVVRRGSGAGLLRVLANALLGRLGRDAGVQVLTGREVDLITREGGVRVLLDGEEHLAVPPLRFRLRPGALTVMAPADAAPATERPA